MGYLRETMMLSEIVDLRQSIMFPVTQIQMMAGDASYIQLLLVSFLTFYDNFFKFPPDVLVWAMLPTVNHTNTQTNAGENTPSIGRGN